MITITAWQVGQHWSTDEVLALDQWADQEGVSLYGWVSLTLLEEEGHITVSTYGYGCGSVGSEDDEYWVRVPPPIPPRLRGKGWLVEDGRLKSKPKVIDALGIKVTFTTR